MIKSRAQREIDGRQRQREREVAEIEEVLPESKDALGEPRVEKHSLKSFDCPLTLQQFVHPVLAGDGQTYERQPFYDWIARSNRSPMTNLPLPSTTTQENYVVKQAIVEFAQDVVPRLQRLQEVEREVERLKKENTRLKRFERVEREVERLKMENTRLHNALHEKVQQLQWQDDEYRYQQDRIQMLEKQLYAVIAEEHKTFASLCNAQHNKEGLHKILRVKNSLITAQHERVTCLREEISRLQKELVAAKAVRPPLSQRPAFFASPPKGPLPQSSPHSEDNAKKKTVTITRKKPKFHLRIEAPVSEQKKTAADLPFEPRPGMILSARPAQTSFSARKTAGLHFTYESPPAAVASGGGGQPKPMRRSFSLSSVPKG